VFALHDLHLTIFPAAPSANLFFFFFSAFSRLAWDQRLTGMPRGFLLCFLAPRFRTTAGPCATGSSRNGRKSHFFFFFFRSRYLWDQFAKVFFHIADPSVFWSTHRWTWSLRSRGGLVRFSFPLWKEGHCGLVFLAFRYSAGSFGIDSVAFTPSPLFTTGTRRLSLSPLIPLFKGGHRVTLRPPL